MPLLPRSYEPLRHPLVFASFPRELVIAPIVLQGFRPGTRRASPVASSVLAPVLSLSPRRSGQASQPWFACPCGLRPTVRDSTSEVPYFRGYHCVHFRDGPGTRLPSSTMALSMGFSVSVSLHAAIQATEHRLLPWWVCFPLNRLALPGHTTVRMVFPYTAFRCSSSSGMRPSPARSRIQTWPHETDSSVVC